MKYFALVTFLVFVPNSWFASSSWGDKPLALRYAYRTQELHPSSPVLPLAKATPVSDTNACKIEPDNGEFYSDKQLQSLASSATVKVTTQNNRGSGTLLAKQGNTYLVITNAHVVRAINSIRVQTPDGQTYSAEIVPKTNLQKYDLALLKFQTNQNYCLVPVTEAIPKPDTPVVAGGFSVEKGGIFQTGVVKNVSDRPFKEGYQIGYTSNISQGMSGGPIIDSRGTLIGINGRSADPILNTGYVYEDGSRPTDEQIKQWRGVAWGIPVATFLAQVNSEILTAYSLPLPKTDTSIPQLQLTGWLGELEQKAKQITVRIDDITRGGNGSGIIIAKDGNTYTVLTVSHVVCETEQGTKPCGDDNYQILAPDGKQYPMERSTIKTEVGVDLAVVKFTSQQNYQVATLADYSPNDKDYMFTGGYPKLGDKSPWRFTAGQIFEKEQGLLQITLSDFHTGSSGLLQSESSLTGGYELVYTSITYGGMSGGPVLDSLGRVIGIHGLVEGQEAIDDKTGDSGSNSGGQVQIGYSLGIPVSTFLGLTQRLGVTPQHVEKTPPASLNEQQVKSIQQTILSADVPKGNATASQWLERGNQLWRLRRYEEAVQDFERAIQLNPSFVYLAYYGKGLALGELGKDKEAIAAFVQAVSKKPDYAAAWKQQSVHYRKLNQFEPALVAIDKAIKLQPNNPNLYNEKCFVLDDLKRYAEAEAPMGEAIKLSPRAVFYIHRGIIYSVQKKWDLALADSNQAIALNPKFALAYFLRGILYQQQKKWDLALADSNQAIALSPKSALAYSIRGLLYREQKKWDLALADYNQVIALNPKDADAYNNRGILYKEQKKWDLALADYNQAIALNPKDVDAYKFRGDIYYEQKKWDLALADYNKAIALNPNYVDAYNNRGNLYKEQKKWDLALADYNKAIALNPNYALTYNNRGFLYYGQQKWDLALVDYNKAIALNPNYALTYNNRGFLYYGQQKWDLALADYNKAIALNPNLALAYNNRRNLYKEQKKWDLALADYNQAIALNPKDVDAYKFRGDIYYEQKKWDLALADYNKAIALNPNYALAYNNRGNLYKEQKKWDLALADYNKAIALNPNYALAYNNRRNLYQQQQKWDLALADSNKAIALNPQDANAYFLRGVLYSSQKKWDLALADYNKAIALNPNYAEAYNNQGLIKYEQGEIDAAIGQWQQATKLNSKLAEPHLALAVALYGKGEKEKAYQLAEIALRLDKSFADVTVLQKNLWGERLIHDAQQLLSSSQIQTLLSQLH
ncbi:MAG: tetratricopeptide repeat protein [Stigonema ocellatum SAG 48.90 = DSM 106950]|nr:tetratricopeptide repeat protein [Stigonema ocellatum SAG 48.90 = DSM 106950]